MGIAKIGPLGEAPRFPDQAACCPAFLLLLLLTANLGQTLRDGQPAIITAQELESADREEEEGKCVSFNSPSGIVTGFKEPLRVLLPTPSTH